MELKDKIELAYKILDEIPKSYDARIGGSIAMCIQGMEFQAEDIDIIVNRVDENLKLPYQELPVKHNKRLNDTKRYLVDGVVVDIHEYIVPRMGLGNVEPMESVIHARKLIKRFLDVVYSENVEKWR